MAGLEDGFQEYQGSGVQHLERLMCIRSILCHWRGILEAAFSLVVNRDHVVIAEHCLLHPELGDSSPEFPQEGPILRSKTVCKCVSRLPKEANIGAIHTGRSSWTRKYENYINHTPLRCRAL